MLYFLIFIEILFKLSVENLLTKKDNNLLNTFWDILKYWLNNFFFKNPIEKRFVYFIYSNSKIKVKSLILKRVYVNKIE